MTAGNRKVIGVPVQGAPVFGSNAAPTSGAQRILGVNDGQPAPGKRAQAVFHLLKLGVRLGGRQAEPRGFKVVLRGKRSSVQNGIGVARHGKHRAPRASGRADYPLDPAPQVGLGLQGPTQIGRRFT